MPPSDDARDKPLWRFAIIACGAGAFGLASAGLFHLVLASRTSSDGDANGMIRFFLCLTVPPFLASCRLLARRRWAGIVVALFGWFIIYDGVSAPGDFGRFDGFTALAVATTLVLSVALFKGENAWKRGF